jgi:hypothetical protein
MYAIISSWRSTDLTEILRTENLQAIVLLSHTEWEYTRLVSPINFNDLLNLSLSKNVPLYIVTGSSSDNDILYDRGDSRFENVKLFYWETYWITDTYYKVNADVRLKRIISEKFYFDVEKKIISSNEPYKYLLLTLNNKPHFHRCVFVDLLAKNNLLERSAISWHEDRYGDELFINVDFISEYRGYNYKFWKPKKYKLTELIDSISFNQNLMPLEYIFSFLHVIVESNSDFIFLTEKTATPLIMGKPFLVFSSQNYYRFLDRLGFLKYDEIIDYSFDILEDLYDRYEMTIQNLIKLNRREEKELKYYYKTMREKIFYNKKIFNKIALDQSRIPNIVREIYNQQPEDLKRIDFELFLCLDYVLNKDKKR